MSTADNSVFKTFGIDIAHQDDDGQYKAFSTGNEKHQSRVRVHYKPNLSEIYPYADMKRIIIELPKAITLIFTGFSITIEGNNLEKSVGDLQDEKIRHIRIYDKTRYSDQPDDDKPVITRIEYSDLHPKE